MLITEHKTCTGKYNDTLLLLLPFLVVIMSAGAKHLTQLV